MLPEIREMIIMASTSSNEKREVLALTLIDEIERKYPREIPPVEETVIKLISKARNHEKSPLDKPWSLAVLNRLHEFNIFGINSEAIEYILKVQCYVDNDIRKFWNRKNIDKQIRQIIRDNPNIDKTVFTEEWKAKYQEKYPYFTIRQAKWVSRFYRLYLKNVGRNKNIGRLYFTALIYSNYEIVSEISGITFDTTHLDQAVHTWSDFRPFVEGYFVATRFDSSLSTAWSRSFTDGLKEKGE